MCTGCSISKQSTRLDVYRGPRRGHGELLRRAPGEPQRARVERGARGREPEEVVRPLGDGHEGRDRDGSYAGRNAPSRLVVVVAVVVAAVVAVAAVVSSRSDDDGGSGTSFIVDKIAPTSRVPTATRYTTRRRRRFFFRRRRFGFRRGARADDFEHEREQRARRHVHACDGDLQARVFVKRGAASSPHVLVEEQERVAYETEPQRRARDEPL
jgi:hypothetical protein